MGEFRQPHGGADWLFEPDELEDFVRALQAHYGRGAFLPAELARDLRVTAALASAAPYTVRHALLAPDGDLAGAIGELLDAALAADVGLAPAGFGAKRAYRIGNGRGGAGLDTFRLGGGSGSGEPTEDCAEVAHQKRAPRPNGTASKPAEEPRAEGAQESSAPAAATPPEHPVEVVQRAPGLPPKRSTTSQPAKRVNGTAAALPEWTPDPERCLYPPAEAIAATGLSGGQVAAWVRLGLVEPTWTTPGGHARWSAGDLRTLRLAAAMRAGGVSTRRLRSALPRVVAEVEAIVAEAGELKT